MVDQRLASWLAFINRIAKFAKKRGKLVWYLRMSEIETLPNFEFFRYYRYLPSDLIQKFIELTLASSRFE